MNKSLGIWVAALLFTGAGLNAEEHRHHAQAAKGGAQSVTGEVIDLFCYLKHPANGRGADHAKCGTTCIKGGLPVGILEVKTGRVYVAVGADHQPATETLLPYVGKTVTVTGEILAGNGTTLISITRIQV